MQIEIILYIIISGVIALLLALFQYFNKKKSMTRLSMLFSFLRFITIFSVLLLLLNLSFKQNETYIENPDLVIAVDNSISIKHLGYGNEAISLVKKLKENQDLNNRFNISTYSFGERFKLLEDSLKFLDNQTDISQVFKQLLQINKNKIAPTILITDGNQTLGNDFLWTSSNYEEPIYPVILGDTITYTDIKIQELNVNKYAFLKNKFPVEVIVVYNGNKELNSKFVITSQSQIVFSKPLNFSKTNNSQIINLTLPANQIGVLNYKAEIVPIDNEKNKTNNIKNFAVEVIDQKTNIALVANMSHPDLGMLKKSIEHNEQRFVKVLDPESVESQINDFELFIIYQPNYKFKEAYNSIIEANKNIWLVVGPKTDFGFLNATSKYYSLETTNQEEFYQPNLNKNYSPFIINDIGFSSFPPLRSNFGDIIFNNAYETILFKSLNGIPTELPLLVSLEDAGRREIVLFGENIWQWRAHSYLQNQSFNDFDSFIGKIVQYLASKQKRTRLNIDYESFYNGNSNVLIKAEYFDKNFVFDSREVLSIELVNSDDKERREFPVILKNKYYQVDLSGLKPSKYNFTIKASRSNIAKSGSFQILDFKVEEQFLNANTAKLKQVAELSSGKAYFISNTDSLVTHLMNDKRFVAIQKSNKKSIPLIDWKLLLGIITLSLSAEWILRKYNGLI
ncbi:VWA domain-containing protein [Cognatitamlana onchidii]|uniref:VWA domain-containing protein n=1 Tax=Cognatitamlana onchidii TaxID=2562860 RepID=UPI0010A6353A|nr:VWA domain-containing protein [Algibacter onchidii]